MLNIKNLLKKPGQFLSKIWKYFVRKSTQLQQWLIKNGPGLKTQKGAIISIFISVFAYLGYLGGIQLRTPQGLLFDIAVGFVIATLSFIFISQGVKLALRILSKIPLKRGAWFIGGFITFILFFGFGTNESIPFVAWFYFTFALLGGAITALIWGNFKTSGLLNKIFVIISFMISIASVILFIIWIGKTGTEEGLIKVEKYEQLAVKHLDLPDPSLNGDYKIKTLSYGSGSDRRDVFGKDATIITERVNGKAFVTKLSGRFNAMRKKYWGFNRTKFPINGRVWYPEGEGKFPLVLIVHGNHSMRDYSDPGYEYLGEFLASKGYILVSVDENFLNGDWTQNYRTENDARGWVLLEHLSAWKNWAKDTSNPFYEKVDMDNIALIGHSRGGEAVAIAASFNNLSHYPDDANIKFNYHFNIRSVIAIAPVDGQYQPSDYPTPLNNVNYLLFQGSHDADVSSFSGDKQFKRIKFDDGEYKFKSSIYIYRANHGQFNTVWGNHDSGMPGALLLNTKALIKGEDQRQIAKVYIGSFLETTLRGNHNYLPLFKDYRYGENWLPDTYYISRFEDSETKFAVDFDEDIDVTTTSIEGGKLMGENLRIWREEDLGFRRGSGLRLNKVVYLGWENAEPKKDSILSDSTQITTNPIDTVGTDSTIIYPSYSVILPSSEGFDSLKNSNSSLVFSIAQLDEKVPKPDSLDTSEENENWSLHKEKKKDVNIENNKEVDKNNTEKEEEADKNKDKEKEKKKDKNKDETEKPKIPIDFTVELTDAKGVICALPISEFISIMPPLEAKFMRYKKFEERYGKSSEPVLQTVAIPFELFKSKNPEFSFEELEQIKFIFNKTSKAVIILDEIGIRKED